MRFFYDCEFIEDGRTIELVSIGVVGEDEREYYAVSSEFDASQAGKWVRKHVLPQLPPPSSSLWRDRHRIRDELFAFLTASDDKPQLWAWFAAYDHVAFAQLWGAMPSLPRELPKLTRDLRQRWEDVGKPELPAAPSDAHHALADARHNLERWRVIEARREELGFPSV